MGDGGIVCFVGGAKPLTLHMAVMSSAAMSTFKSILNGDKLPLFENSLIHVNLFLSCSH